MQSDREFNGVSADVSSAPDIPSTSEICLFVDIDGTLVDFADHPAQAFAEPQLLISLRALEAALDGALAVISGRTVECIDLLLRPLKLPAAGIHGVERRDGWGRMHSLAPPSSGLDEVRKMLFDFTAGQPGVLVEDKRSGFAVHYHRAPHLEYQLRAAVVRAAATLVPAYTVLEGRSVLEIRPAGLNKGTAVHAFMSEPPFHGRIPLFVGDDLTDLDGFAAVRNYGGLGIAVGDRIVGDRWLPDPGAARVWIARLASTGTGDGR